MGLYEGIKDVAKIAQKADNIELYKQLLDLGAQALDMQEEIRRLKEANAELKDEKNLKSKICRHISKKIDSFHNEHPYITLLDDVDEIRYCAICWGRDKKLIQLYDELNCEECSRLKQKNDY